uniref:ABC transporter domain-containing protein n=1 Tax=Fagus sylvatica TaxID=28930 RepID=A0A2N9EXU5_FAGSY
MELPVSSGKRIPYRIETKNVSYKLCGLFDELNWVCFETPKRAPKFILSDVNCEARPGEITAIAGPSGAGKTTLLEILAGKISPRNVSGQVPGLVGNQIVAFQGGERRRVSIGVDLVHDPAVLLIDEPTSGLDSASALHVLSLLRAMVVNQGKTIVLTIHQPGFRILQLFDRIVLLSNGFVMHNGSLNLLEERLKLAGHGIPPHVNVLEFAIDAIESLVIHTSETLNDQSNLEEYKDEVHHMRNVAYPTNIGEENLLFYQNSRLEEVLILGQRFSNNIFRTKQLFTTRVIQSLVAGFVLGTIFMNVAREQGSAALQTRIGFFAFSLTFLLSSTTEGLPIFLQERRILMNEISRGAYRVSSYIIANTLVFLPFLLMVCLLYTTPVYWLIGLKKDINAFLYFSMVVWMVLLMSNSFVACFSALVPNFIMGTSVISGLMGSFFLFSGMEENKGGQSAYKLWKDNAVCMQMGSYDREI